MDKKLVLHEIAMESAKAFCKSNFPEYAETGTSGYASDLVEKYFIAYTAAEESYNKHIADDTSDSITSLK